MIDRLIGCFIHFFARPVAARSMPRLPAIGHKVPGRARTLQGFRAFVAGQGQEDD